MDKFRDKDIRGIVVSSLPVMMRDIRAFDLWEVRDA